MMYMALPKSLPKILAEASPFTQVYRLGFDSFIWARCPRWIFATDHSDYHPNFQFNPQIKYNVGKHLSGADRRVHLGVESY